MTDKPLPASPGRSNADSMGSEYDTPALSDLAGAAYSTLIDAQLAEERSSKTSLEHRGITVITTSGSVVGLLFGLLAVIGGTTEFVLPVNARLWFVAALVVLTLSAIGGLLVNVPRNYEEADEDDLQSFLVNPDGSWAPEWEESITEGSRRVAQVNLNVLRVARKKNKTKARLLFYAQVAEVVGIGLLAMAVGSAL